jgi:hypothetical protein
MEFHGIFHKHLTDFFIIFSMEFHGKFNGIPWNSIEFYESEVDGIPWN